MHLIFRNQRSTPNHRVSVQVLDAQGHATRAGAEVRIYQSGTRRLIAMRLLDTGSGYNAQNDMPVLIGLPNAGAVDVEVTWPANGRRAVKTVRSVRPGASSRPITITTP
jgi:hypothetical protein